jgi:hypothetical protein
MGAALSSSISVEDAVKLAATRTPGYVPPLGKPNPANPVVFFDIDLGRGEAPRPLGGRGGRGGREHAREGERVAPAREHGAARVDDAEPDAAPEPQQSADEPGPRAADPEAARAGALVLGRVLGRARLRLRGGLNVGVKCDAVRGRLLLPGGDARARDAVLPGCGVYSDGADRAAAVLLGGEHARG